MTQSICADGVTSNLKALQLKSLSRSPSQIIKRARSPFSGFDKVESGSGAIVPERKCQ
ncbi:MULTISPECIES: hypothetical protein [unclassified Microcoleus]|uniref:hypothetical protein n=1 Tax=unclassified Microcoleus TaxID=2642155 RepID=UPI002FD04905